MEGDFSEILVIGAGMAGLACATALTRAGRQVVALDKGRGPGGRMAARRVEIAGKTVSFDHGAQYFTANDAEFRAKVTDWERAGIAARWPAAGVHAWVGVPGMNAPLRAMAQGCQVAWSSRADHVVRDGRRWVVQVGDRRFTSETLLVAVPAEQAQGLLRVAAPDLASLAGGVRSAPCWAVMAAFAARLAIASDILRDGRGPIVWAARNSAKPRRAGRECWVIHASPVRSQELLELPAQRVAELVLADFFAGAGLAPTTPVHLDAHRWLYALPDRAGATAARFDPVRRIGIAGDYLIGPRVESAWVSGTALARQVIAAG